MKSRIYFLQEKLFIEYGTFIYLFKIKVFSRAMIKKGLKRICTAQFFLLEAQSLGDGQLFLLEAHCAGASPKLRPRSMLVRFNVFCQFYFFY